MSPMPRRELRAVIALAILLSASLVVMALTRSHDTTPATSSRTATATDTIAPVKLDFPERKQRKKSTRNKRKTKQPTPVVDRPSPLDEPLPTLTD